MWIGGDKGVPVLNGGMWVVVVGLTGGRSCREGWVGGIRRWKGVAAGVNRVGVLDGFAQPGVVGWVLQPKRLIDCFR